MEQPKFEKEQLVGYVVEQLISIKDRFRDSLYGTELDALNNACNIIDHRFSNLDTAEKIIDEIYSSTMCTKEDIKERLSENGYEVSDYNVSVILKHNGFIKTLQESLANKQNEAIDFAICLSKDSLAKAEEVE